LRWELIAQTQTSSFKDVNLIPNTTYEYQIKTKDKAGIESVGLTKKIITFADSDIRGHWAEQDILGLKEKGCISGYPDGTYAITLANALNLPYSYDKNDNKTIKDYDDMSIAWWEYRPSSHRCWINEPE
jgi:hypothetical protein